MEGNSSFNKIYVDNASKLYRFCYFQLKKKEDAEDVVSEAFIQLYRFGPEKIENHSAWLYKVARNIMYKKYFTNKIEQKTLASNEIVNEVLEKSDLEGIVLDEESVRIIKDELENLDPSIAEVISLRVWNDLKFSEISDITGKNEDSVKKIFYRGLDKLKSNINSKPNYQLKSFTLPVIAAGILAFGNSSYFNLSGSSLSAIAGSIASNLNITNFFMNSANTVAASSTAATTLTGVSAKTATAGFFSTTAAKIIIGTVGTASIVGGGVGGAVVINEYNRSNELEPVSYAQVDETDTVTVPGVNEESSVDLTKDCSYKTEAVTIAYKVPSDWNCKYDNSSLSPFGEFSNDKFKFRIGFLFEAICQDPNGQCSSENIYTSDKFKLDYVENVNTDGSKYYKLAGSFNLNNGDGIKEINSYAKATKLSISAEEKKVIKAILDSFIMPATNSSVIPAGWSTSTHNCGVTYSLPPKELPYTWVNNEDPQSSLYGKTWYWSVGEVALDPSSTHNDFFSLNYDCLMYLQFVPGSRKDYACGTGCIREIMIQIKSGNTNNQTLDQLMSNIEGTIASINAELIDVYGPEAHAIKSKEKIQKWGKDVYKFNLDSKSADSGGEQTYYLVISNNTFYVINSFTANPDNTNNKAIQTIIDLLAFTK